MKAWLATLGCGRTDRGLSSSEDPDRALPRFSRSEMSRILNIPVSETAVATITLVHRSGWDDMIGARVSSFDARLHLPGQTRIPLNVVVDIEGDRISFKSGDQTLGNWSLEEVDKQLKSDGFYLNIGNEKIILSVADSATFASALGLVDKTRSQRSANQNVVNGTVQGISRRLEGIAPEDRVDDIRRRMADLKSAMTDDSISPPELFRRWLTLLKDINVRHGQGSIPSTIFYRLNTEILDLMPVPASSHVPEFDPEPVEEPLVV